MAQKKTVKSENLEREYVIPLRKKFKHVARYKKTPKAVKEVKKYLARHMKIYDRDLDKIRLSKFVNEFIWARGIKNPPHKIKVKATKQGEIVRVELVDMPDKLKFKKAREEKIETDAKEKIESKKTMMQKAKESMQSRGSEAKKPSEETKEGEEKDKDADGVEDKKEEKEKKKAVQEAGKAMEKEMAKKAKHTTKIKKPAQKKVEIKQPSR
jgi:large subunit ribosomal protein L31e